MGAWGLGSSPSRTTTCHQEYVRPLFVQNCWLPRSHGPVLSCQPHHQFCTIAAASARTQAESCSFCLTCVLWVAPRVVKHAATNTSCPPSPPTCPPTRHSPPWRRGRCRELAGRSAVPGPGQAPGRTRRPTLWPGAVQHVAAARVQSCAGLLLLVHPAFSGKKTVWAWVQFARWHDLSRETHRFFVKSLLLTCFHAPFKVPDSLFLFTLP